MEANICSAWCFRLAAASAHSLTPHCHSPLTTACRFQSNTKYPSMDYEKGGSMLVTPARRTRPLALGFITVALLYFAWFPIATVLSPLPSTSRLGWMPCPSTLLTGTKAPVPLEAHIMSKCPDAVDCLRMLVLPTMQRVYDKVNFTLSFIGT